MRQTEKEMRPYMIGRWGDREIWHRKKGEERVSKVGDQKSPFLIATTLRCRGGGYSFPGLLHFTLDMYLILLSVKQGSIKYHF